MDDDLYLLLQKQSSDLQLFFDGLPTHSLHETLSTLFPAICDSLALFAEGETQTYCPSSVPELVRLVDAWITSDVAKETMPISAEDLLRIDQHMTNLLKRYPQNTLLHTAVKEWYEDIINEQVNEWTVALAEKASLFSLVMEWKDVGYGDYNDE